MGDVDGDLLEKAFEHAETYQGSAPDDPHAYRLLSRVQNGLGMYEEAQRCVERAFTLNRNDSDMVINTGVFALFSGDPNKALEIFDGVLEQHSETPFTVDIIRMWKSAASFIKGDYANAISMVREVNGFGFWKSLWLAAYYAQAGDDQNARKMAEAVRAARPEMRISILGVCKSFRNPDDQALLSGALVKAGIPE